MVVAVMVVILVAVWIVLVVVSSMSVNNLFIYLFIYLFFFFFADNPWVGPANVEPPSKGDSLTASWLLSVLLSVIASLATFS